MQHTITVDDPSVLDAKVVMLARNDKVIELYAVDEHGLEQYAGRLEHLIGADERKIARLLRAIKERIKERPLSRESQHWLNCLAHAGMLARWEDPHVR